jgi:outer membrane protein assembly factor BamD (BamD/ComL family)
MPDAPPARARPDKGGTTQAKGSLLEETQLLRHVHAEIRNGNPQKALAQLAEYDQRFGKGVLRAEHQAARVLALCQMGETRKARAEAERFLSRWPSSPLAPRLKAACLDR